MAFQTCPNYIRDAFETRWNTSRIGSQRLFHWWLNVLSYLMGVSKSSISFLFIMLWFIEIFELLDDKCLKLTLIYFLPSHPCHFSVVVLLPFLFLARPLHHPADNLFIFLFFFGGGDVFGIFKVIKIPW